MGFGEMFHSIATEDVFLEYVAETDAVLGPDAAPDASGLKPEEVIGFAHLIKILKTCFNGDLDGLGVTKWADFESEFYDWLSFACTLQSSMRSAIMLEPKPEGTSPPFFATSDEIREVHALLTCTWDAAGPLVDPLPSEGMPAVTHVLSKLSTLYQSRRLIERFKGLPTRFLSELRGIDWDQGIVQFVARVLDAHKGDKDADQFDYHLQSLKHALPVAAVALVSSTMAVRKLVRLESRIAGGGALATLL